MHTKYYFIYYKYRAKPNLDNFDYIYENLVIDMHPLTWLVQSLNRYVLIDWKEISAKAYYEMRDGV